MTLSLYDLPPVIFTLLPLIGAAALAFLAFAAGRWLLKRLERSRMSRVEAFAPGEEGDPRRQTVPIGSPAHRLRLAFARYHIDARGKEQFYLWLAHLFTGGAMFLALLILGLPVVTSLVGFLGGYVIVNGLIGQVWNRTRTEIEAEIPTLLSSMQSALEVAANVPAALETASQTLRAGGPLRGWTLETAARMHAQGHPAMPGIAQDAAGISTSLAIVAELIGRMWTTGGEGYAQAFETAADNLGSVLDARVMARSKGDGARGTVKVLVLMTLVMIAFLTRSPAMAAVVRQPIVQVAYAAIALLIVYGYSMTNDMIDNAI